VGVGLLELVGGAVDGELLELGTGAALEQVGRQRGTVPGGDDPPQVGLDAAEKAAGRHERPQPRLEPCLQRPPHLEEAGMPLPCLVDLGERPVVELVEKVETEVEVVASERVVVEGGMGRERVRWAGQVVDEELAERAASRGQRWAHVDGGRHGPCLPVCGAS
jgi:hypothetical protein